MNHKKLFSSSCLSPLKLQKTAEKNPYFWKLHQPPQVCQRNSIIFLYFPDKNLNVQSNIFQIFYMDCQCLLLKNTWDHLTFLKDGGHKQLIVIWTICCTPDKHFNFIENTDLSTFLHYSRNCCTQFLDGL